MAVGAGAHREARMDICGTCGKALGSNQECEECLNHLIGRGSKGIDEKKAKDALGRGEQWLEGKGKSAPQILYSRVKLLIEMVRDYFSGTYKDIPWTSVAAMAFGIVYVVNPFDLVPDFIPFAGYVDDIAVVALVVAAVQLDLRKYCEFRGYDLGDYGF